MKIKKFFGSTIIMIAVLSLACAALAISWPEWRDDLRTQGYYGYGFNLPDTGQTKCYQEVAPYSEIPCIGTGQDGGYNINPMSYTDNEDGTVTDNNTGLMWQQDENPTYYNWYKASGTYDATYNPTSQDVCGELRTSGYSDWRLPTKKELMSIVDYSIPEPGPTIQTAFFPNAYASNYWSSTTYAYGPNGAWYVGFDWSYIGGGYKGHDYYVRCVRGEEMDFGNFVDNYDGTITDNSTGLIWQQGEPGYMTWSDALDYCENLELPSGSGQTDWRLPNFKELESITDDILWSPTIDRKYFPNAYAYDYWSSTTYASHPGNAWFVNFENGRVNYYSKGGYNDVRCVLGGEMTQTHFEETDPVIAYTGAWNTKSCPSCSGGGLKYSNQTGAKAVFSFNGTGIKWIFAKANNLGKAKVYLDGVYKGLVDLYSSTTKYQVVLQKTGLAPGAHTVTIEVSGQKYLLSKGSFIDIDAFEVIP